MTIQVRCRPGRTPRWDSTCRRDQIWSLRWADAVLAGSGSPNLTRRERAHVRTGHRALRQGAAGQRFWGTCTVTRARGARSRCTLAVDWKRAHPSPDVKGPSDIELAMPVGENESTPRLCSISSMDSVIRHTSAQ